MFVCECEWKMCMCDLAWLSGAFFLLLNFFLSVLPFECLIELRRWKDHLSAKPLKYSDFIIRLTIRSNLNYSILFSFRWKNQTTTHELCVCLPSRLFHERLMNEKMWEANDFANALLCSRINGKKTNLQNFLLNARCHPTKWRMTFNSCWTRTKLSKITATKYRKSFQGRWIHKTIHRFTNHVNHKGCGSGGDGCDDGNDGNGEPKYWTVSYM